MGKIKFILFGVLILISINSKAQVVVKGLKLKYVLIETANEMYRSNVLCNKTYSTKNALYYGKHSIDYLNWLKYTYSLFPDNRKSELKNIFTKNGRWNLMNLITDLNDTANIDEIVLVLLSSNEIDSSTRKDIQSFFPYFYNSFLKDYLLESSTRIDKLVEKTQSKINSKSIDVFAFMEEKSGCNFKNEYSSELFYTLSPFRASGFTKNNIYVSTLQQNRKDAKEILSTVFHEYSHELFKTFSLDQDFTDISKKLKTNPDFKMTWENGYKNSYDWRGWCEENLVNGFSAFLTFKYFGSFKWRGNYIYDKEFYKYLKKIDFDPDEISLAKVCRDFMKSKIETTE